MTSTDGDISRRVWFRWENEEPFENTSTIVLTAPSSTFVDVRLFKDPASPSGQLEWAFSGHSERSFNKSLGVPHKKWIHTIDSRCAFDVKANDDEGDMFPYPSELDSDPNLGLEAGAMAHPDTGAVTSYQELWEGVSAIATDSDLRRECVVLTHEDASIKSRGIIIRVGQFCQGLHMIDDVVEVERWESRNGSWTNVARIATSEQVLLPCASTFKPESLRHGMIIEFGDASWIVRELSQW